MLTKDLFDEKYIKDGKYFFVTVPIGEPQKIGNNSQSQKLGITVISEDDFKNYELVLNNPMPYPPQPPYVKKIIQ